MRRMFLSWNEVADFISHIEPKTLRTLELGGSIQVPELLEQKRSMMIFIETLVMSKFVNLDSLGLEGWGLRGIQGVRTRMQKLRYLSMAGN